MSKPTYSDSEGNRYTTDQINRKSDKAANSKLVDQLVDYGYNFCEECERNDCKPIDVSHTVSRKKAKELGKVELIWDKNNMEILGRRCHKIKDQLV
jgi:5-methylcytosine-specific restriction endonuclease McrA